MNRNNNLVHFDPHRYEEHLSPFGQQVLKVLVQQWKTTGNKERERDNNNYNVNKRYQQRRRRDPAQKVLTFTDYNVPPHLDKSTSTVVPRLPDPVDFRTELNNDIPLANILFIKNSIPITSTITKTVELVNTVDANEVAQEDTNLSRDALIKPAFDKPQNIVHELYNKASDEEDVETILVKHTPEKVDNPLVRTGDVSWDNMFDTELLPEFNTPASTGLLETIQNNNENENIFKCPTTQLLATIQNDIENEKTFQFSIPQQSKTDLDSDVNHETTGTEKQERQADTAKKVLSKRQNQSKITDVIPKKVKKAEIEKSKTLKNSFRKQKYTKVIKNWLNDVEPNNLDDDEVIDDLSIKEVQIESKAKENYPKPEKHKIAIEKFPKDKTNKKVIQAQLTNKGGVMKFGKPNAVTLNSDNKTSSEQSVENENNNVKEKKNKPKFVAPIKSQIPVKDIAYEIYKIDEINKEHEKYLWNVECDEVAVIIVYRNGFCQLNNHYTEDSCVPEGILINFDDKFYFLKGVQKKFGEIFKNIISNNSIICYEGKNLFIHLINHFNFDIHENLNIYDAKVCKELQQNVQMYQIVREDINLLTVHAMVAQIGGSLLNPDNPPENFSELQQLLSFTPQYTIATECVLQKSAWYTTLLKECNSRLKSLLMANLSWNVFVEIEMKLLPIIADMERRGVCVDLEKLKSMENILLAKIKIIEQECYKAAGKVFQINSTVQVRKILYEELQLDNKCNFKVTETIAKGAKSTSESMLRNLVTVHPLPKLILEYRHLHKAHATFLTGIAQHVKNGVVKPTWVQMAAATGRIASNNPNLQAIPKAPFNLVMFPDADNKENQVLSFRSVYTSRPGYTFLAADFKHVECRVFAHAAADTGLLEALKSPDLFKVLAAKWLKKQESEISSEDRERTKRIVYASMYGAGARKLMDILNVSYDQALSIISSFNRTFPALKSFGRSVVSRCEQLGGRLTTICGRGRSFKDISSSDFTLRSHAERQAVNFVVQGSAADLCKLAMVHTAQHLRGANPPVEGHLVLQIHDELVWEIRDEDLERAAGIIKEVMESCGQRCGMWVALPVAMARGRDWGTMTPFTP